MIRWASKRPSPGTIFSLVAKTRWLEAISVVRSLTQPFCSARPASTSSEATIRSTLPGVGVSASKGSRPASCASGTGKISR